MPRDGSPKVFLSLRLLQLLIYSYYFSVLMVLLQLPTTVSGFAKAGFEAQNCQPALNLNRSTKPQVCTSPRLTQNPCYRLCFFLLRPLFCLCCRSVKHWKINRISNKAKFVSLYMKFICFVYHCLFGNCYYWI